MNVLLNEILLLFTGLVLWIVEACFLYQRVTFFCLSQHEEHTCKNKEKRNILILIKVLIRRNKIKSVCCFCSFCSFIYFNDFFCFIMGTITFQTVFYYCLTMMPILSLGWFSGRSCLIMTSGSLKYFQSEAMRA